MFTKRGDPSVSVAAPHVRVGSEFVMPCLTCKCETNWTVGAMVGDQVVQAFCSHCGNRSSRRSKLTSAAFGKSAPLRPSKVSVSLKPTLPVGTFIRQPTPEDRDAWCSAMSVSNPRADFVTVLEYFDLGEGAASKYIASPEFGDGVVLETAPHLIVGFWDAVRRF